MNKLYQKSELTFSLILIAFYVVFISLCDALSDSLGISKIITAPVLVGFSLLLFIWLRKNGLTQKYGLTAVKGKAKDYLFYIPFVMIALVNLLFGVKLTTGIAETVLYIISMLMVGFVEEIIFRGFLFKALCKDSVKAAVIISSVTFGMGHIVNLLNGSDLVPTLLQICYAAAGGFMFTVFFIKSGSLIPCIITHSVLNSLSIFSAQTTDKQSLVTAVLMTAVSTAYGIYILKRNNK